MTSTGLFIELEDEGVSGSSIVPSKEDLSGFCFGSMVNGVSGA